MTKLASVYDRATTLLKRWSTIGFFLKTFFLRQLVFGTYSKKNVRWSLFIVELQSVHCSLVTLLKQTPLFPNFHNQLFFVTSSFVLKNQTTRKITWKSVGKGRLVSEALWKYNEYWIFLCERFSFYEKVPSPPTPAGLFSKWSLLEFLFSKLLACKLQPNSLCVFVTPGITSPVDFLSTETSANRLSTEQVL